MFLCVILSLAVSYSKYHVCFVIVFLTSLVFLLLHLLLYLKENVEFWEEMQNNLWALSLLLCKCGRTSDKKCSLKSMALLMLSYTKYGMYNNIKIGTNLYATCSCSPIFIFMCTMLVTLPRHGHFLQIILMISEPCSTHHYLYATWSTLPDLFHTVSFTMQLHDQNSTLSLNQFNHLNSHHRNKLFTLWGKYYAVLLLWTPHRE